MKRLLILLFLTSCCNTAKNTLNNNNNISTTNNIKTCEEIARESLKSNVFYPLGIIGEVELVYLKDCPIILLFFNMMEIFYLMLRVAKIL